MVNFGVVAGNEGSWNLFGFLKLAIGTSSSPILFTENGVEETAGRMSDWLLLAVALRWTRLLAELCKTGRGGAGGLEIGPCLTLARGNPDLEPNSLV